MVVQFKSCSRGKRAANASSEQRKWGGEGKILSEVEGDRRAHPNVAINVPKSNGENEQTDFEPYYSNIYRDWKGDHSNTELSAGDQYSFIHRCAGTSRAHTFGEESRSRLEKPRLFTSTFFHFIGETDK